MADERAVPTGQKEDEGHWVQPVEVNVRSEAEPEGHDIHELP